MGSFIRGLSDHMLDMENGFLFEDMLDGVSNYNPWKERIMLVLIENGIWEFDNTKLAPPMDVIYLVIHN
jgi:hypothetical protein